jgi:formate dehydrogenase major subunit
VAGVANTWGYGAQTNSYNDLRNAKTMLILGGNPAEAHPIAVQHLLAGKEINRANFIVIDPRFTRTAAHGTEYVRLRPGTDIAFLMGMMWHIVKNGWEDKEFIRQRVYGMDQVIKEIEKYPPDEVERITGVPGEQIKRVAEKFAKEKPSTLIWCMGQTQHTVGTANVRASCIALLLTGNVGANGTGANIFRGHTQRAGRTDLGLDITTLPLYYGLTEGAWKHWAASGTWNTNGSRPVRRGAREGGRKARTRKENMEAPGITSTRWFDAVNLPEDQIDQRSLIRGMVVFGHGGNTGDPCSGSREGPGEARPPRGGRSASDLLRADVGAQEQHLPAADLHELRDRRLPHGVEPLAAMGRAGREADLRVARRLRRALPPGQQARLRRPDVQEHQGGERPARARGRPARDQPRRMVDRLYGQSPERLKAHMRNQGKFDLVTLRAPKDDPEVGGDYYGLPWPCWGKPELRHPGSAVLYNTNLHVKDGGGTFRARFGLERNGETLLADGSFSAGSEITDGYPEFTMGVFKKLGWDKDLTPEETAIINRMGGNQVDAVSWATDLSGGIQRVCLEKGVSPFGNAKARVIAWNLPDPVPTHREPIYSSRPISWPSTRPGPTSGSSACPNIGHSVRRPRWSETSSRSSRSSSPRDVSWNTRRRRGNPLQSVACRLQQDMFVEINTADAADRGIKDGQWVWVRGPESQASRG